MSHRSRPAPWILFAVCLSAAAAQLGAVEPPTEGPLDARAFRPVYGDVDSARLPPFWSLDVRVDKDWVYKNWTLTAYLDLQNATNNQNVEVMAWTFDYAEEDPITSIPVVPAFGVRGEW